MTPDPIQLIADAYVSIESSGGLPAFIALVGASLAGLLAIRWPANHIP
jgi:hypothetical protein